MKLKFLSLLTATTLLLSCGEYRETTTSDYSAYGVPMEIHTTFVDQYPTATNFAWTTYDANLLPIDWDFAGWPVMNETDYVVQFDMDGDRYFAYYDATGEWIGSAYAITNFESLPTLVKNTINREYGGYSITEINREFRGDSRAYEVELKNMDSKVTLLINENGSILKRKTKVND